MNKRFAEWLLEKLSSSNSTLLQKISDSLERDKDIPFRFLVRKGLIFFYSIVTAPINLLGCDEVGKRVRTRHRPYIENMGSMSIGDEVNINSRNVQTDLVTGPNGRLEIGNKTSINFGVSIVANARISIGERVRIGPYTMIYDSNMHVHGNRYKRAPGDAVTIGDDVWLASKVLVLKGSRVGKGSIVAAGSVVSGIIPPYVVAAGTPARIVKFIQPSDESGFMWEQKDNSTSIDEEIYRRVSRVASKSFSLPVNDIRASDSHNSIEGWNSFRHVKFIKSLENEFNIEIDDQDWTRFTSIEKICKIIEDYTKKEFSTSQTV